MDFTTSFNSKTSETLGNAIIFGSSLFSISIMTYGILTDCNNYNNMLYYQIQNLIMKKYQKKITDENVEQFNNDVYDILNNKSIYSILYNTLATGIIGSFIYVATVSYKKLHL